jgi:hypothetical protein
MHKNINCNTQRDKELQRMPGKWSGYMRGGRYVFRLTLKEREQFLVIQFRSTKPVGWVVYRKDITSRILPSGVRAARAKKVDPNSYPSPSAAAVALALAGLLPEEK